MKTLVIDVGGTHVKALTTGRTEPVKIPSGREMTPKQMIAEILESVNGWKFQTISIGYPGPVLQGRPAEEPANLGPGWVGFDFEKALGRPVRVINDAAMQALGSYEGGRMLFLGLGTGLGSTLIINNVLQPMELAHLPYRHNRTYEDYTGIRGLKRLGEKKWRAHVTKIVEQLKHALQVDYVVLGGGNSKRFDAPPPDCRFGDNANAFRGGFRLWQHHSKYLNGHKKG
jgi:polyphosphate glucokinase